MDSVLDCNSIVFNSESCIMGDFIFPLDYFPGEVNRELPLTVTPTPSISGSCTHSTSASCDQVVTVDGQGVLVPVHY